jgi:hypothetical protein
VEFLECERIRHNSQYKYAIQFNCEEPGVLFWTRLMHLEYAYTDLEVLSGVNDRLSFDTEAKETPMKRKRGD